MNKLSLNFKYTALQILYWAEASIVFVYVGFYLQAAGMSNGSVGVTIAFANILSFALSNAFAELIDRKNKLTSFTASVFLLGLKILLSCSLAVLKDRNALPVAILYMFLIVFNLMSSIVYNKLYVDIEKSGNTVNFSRARGMGSLSFAVASAILGGLTLKFSVFVIPPGRSRPVPARSRDSLHFRGEQHRKQFLLCGHRKRRRQFGFDRLCEFCSGSS